MRRIIAAFNMTVDGFCDHTAGIPDAELHHYYEKMLGEADAILYGRITYELMAFWKTLVEHPSGEQAMDDFAIAIHKVPKIVFSNSIKDIDWETASLANKSLVETVLELKQQTGKDVFVGSRSLIVELLNRNLIDELRLCIHPVMIGKGLPLFDQIQRSLQFKLIKTQTFQSGAIVLFYQAKEVSQ